jgi:hypothetical protein
MKNRIITVLSLITLNLGLFAQANFTYSLTRPTGGGNLNFVKFDIALGAETIIKTYLPSELNDYNPEATSFDNQNNRFITVGDFGSTDSLIAINITNGNIDFAYKSNTEEIFSIEVSNSSSVNTYEIPFSDENVRIFPNPFRNLIKISSDFKIEYINITDFSGKVLLSEIGDFSYVDLSKLPDGVYWISIKQSDKILTKMIIKQD